MSANPAKCQIMFLGTTETIPEFLTNGIAIPVTKVVKLLGITPSAIQKVSVVRPSAIQKVSVVRPLV